MSTASNQFAKFQQGLSGFAAEMKAKNIHVGMGTPPTCVNCGESWPCSTEVEPTPITED